MHSERIASCYILDSFLMHCLYSRGRALSTISGITIIIMVIVCLTRLRELHLPSISHRALCTVHHRRTVCGHCSPFLSPLLIVSHLGLMCLLLSQSAYLIIIIIVVKCAPEKSDEKGSQPVAVRKDQAGTAQLPLCYLQCITTSRQGDALLLVSINSAH